MTSVTDDLPLAADFPKATVDDWRKLVDGVLKGAPFEKLVGKTYDGLKIDPLYPRARGVAPVVGRPAGRAVADHAADRPSRCGARECAGADRSRKWRDGARAGVRRRQWRSRFRAGTVGRCGRKDLQGYSSRCRHRHRAPDRSAIADGGDPCRGICEEQRHRSRRLRHPLRARSACGRRGVGSQPLHMGRDRSGRHRRHQGARRARLQGTVRVRRRARDPRCRRLRGAGARVRARLRRRLSARDRRRRRSAGAGAGHDLCAALLRMPTSF